MLDRPRLLAALSDFALLPPPKAPPPLLFDRFCAAARFWLCPALLEKPRSPPPRFALPRLEFAGRFAVRLFIFAVPPAGLDAVFLAVGAPALGRAAGAFRDPRFAVAGRAAGVFRASRFAVAGRAADVFLAPRFAALGFTLAMEAPGLALFTAPRLVARLAPPGRLLLLPAPR